MTPCRQIRKNEIWRVRRRRDQAVKVNIIDSLASPGKDIWTESNECGGALVSLHVVSTNGNNSSPDSCRGEKQTPRLAGFITPSPDRAVWLDAARETSSISHAKFMSGHEMMRREKKLLIPLKCLLSNFLLTLFPGEFLTFSEMV